MDLKSGATLQVPSWLNSEYAFDHALGRSGWVAVQVDRQVAAFTDGSLTDPTRLPEAWQMYPAASQNQVLLIRRFGDDNSPPDEKYSAAVVGPDGQMHRSALLPWGVGDLAFLAGEVEEGVVSWAGIAGWDDTVSELPVAMTGDPLTDPRPFGVLAGRVILFEGVDFVEAVDTFTGDRRRVGIPPVQRGGPFASRFGLGVAYNDDATWLHAVDRSGPVLDTPGSIVAGVEGELRWLPRQPTAGPRQNVIWSANRLLVADFEPASYDPASDTYGTTDAMMYDPVANAFTSTDISVDGSEVRLRLDVTNHFAWPV